MQVQERMRNSEQAPACAGGNAGCGKSALCVLHAENVIWSRLDMTQAQSVHTRHKPAAYLGLFALLVVEHDRMILAVVLDGRCERKHQQAAQHSSSERVHHRNESDVLVVDVLQTVAKFWQQPGKLAAAAEQLRPRCGLSITGVPELMYSSSPCTCTRD